MALLGTPTFAITPQPTQGAALPGSYIASNQFNFLTQYLPDTYEKEFERYGNRTVASFLRMVGAELPSNSDSIKWAEQGRLHIKYTSCTAGAATTGGFTLSIADTGVTGTNVAIRVGQTVLVQNNTSGVTNKGVVTAITTATPPVATIACYDAVVIANTNVCTMFVYGSEFRKGTQSMTNTLDANDTFYSNNPIIIKETYTVNGSDMAQIGWVEVTTENGATGYLWYLKSEHETRLRFEDYLETAMLEAIPATNANAGSASAAGLNGSEGVFHAVNSRGNVWGGAIPATLAEWDTIVARLDRQGAIEENAVFVNRDLSFAIDNMLATLNGYVAAGTASQSASFGLFDNDVQMALNLGFTGFRRGYDFYKSDWKYLNDPSLRGALNTTAATAAGTITGLLVPAGSTTVYDQIMGKNAKRPFLHVRYRASEAEDRRYKTWITGSAGGASTSDLDAMSVNFLSERCVCVLGANNFVLFRYGA